MYYVTRYEEQAPELSWLLTSLNELTDFNFGKLTVYTCPLFRNALRQNWILFAITVFFLRYSMPRNLKKEYLCTLFTKLNIYGPDLR